MNLNLFVLISIFCANINCQNDENGLSLDAESRNPNLEPEPNRARNLCKKIIPKNIANVEITPGGSYNGSDNTVLKCDSSSAFKQISVIYTGEQVFTCYGIQTFTFDNVHNNVIFRNSNKKRKIIMNNYTTVFTFTNGNFFLVECGTIVGGPCDGDKLWGTATFQADDQEGCARNGVSADVGVARFIDIVGKCQSKCSLGYSLTLYDNPINNNGVVQKVKQNDHPDTL